MRDDRAGFYVVDHFFRHPDGSVRTPPRACSRRWQRRHGNPRTSVPHERTLSGPKEDRLALMRATRTQTSPVFAVWTDAGRIAETLDRVATGTALLGGRIDGEIASEKLLLWRVARPGAGGRDQQTALRRAALYVADGHHRYETAAAYAAERRAAEPDAPPDAPFERCLVYLAAADDPGITILPTHRLVRPGPGIAFSLDDLWARLDDAYETVPAADGRAALDAAAAMHATHHAFAIVAHDGAAVLRRPRRAGGSPRDRLDVAVLETEVLGPAGVSRDMISGGRARLHARPGRARRRGANAATRCSRSGCRR